MTDNKKKSQNLITRQNVLETLKDIGSSTGGQTKDLLKDTSEEFFRELLGLSRSKVKRTGEISPGESLSMRDILNGSEAVKEKEKKQIKFENTLLAEEARVSREKGNELKVELQAVMSEVAKLAQSTKGLAEATRAASVSAPVEPGIYHIRFFESLLEFLQSFRKRIDLAVTWLQSSNKRAEKKNYWSQYHKKGTSFLLNPESYSQRSTG